MREVRVASNANILKTSLMQHLWGREAGASVKGLAREASDGGSDEIVLRSRTAADLCTHIMPSGGPRRPRY